MKGILCNLLINNKLFNNFVPLNKKTTMSKDFEYLIHSNRVILSPHIAGWTVESYEKLATVLADKIEAIFR